MEDILEGAHTPGGKSRGAAKRVAETTVSYRVNYEKMSPKELGKLIGQLEDKMYEAAKNLEFEQAAKYRDEISEIHSALLG